LFKALRRSSDIDGSSSQSGLDHEGDGESADDAFLAVDSGLSGSGTDWDCGGLGDLSASLEGWEE
jgi:hypothetical protein